MVSFQGNVSHAAMHIACPVHYLPPIAKSVRHHMEPTEGPARVARPLVRHVTLLKTLPAFLVILGTIY